MRNKDEITQWIPSSLIEPIEEVIKAIFDHVGRGTIIEPVKVEKIQSVISRGIFHHSNHSPWIEFVNNTFKSDNSEQSRGKAGDPAHEQHRKNN
jgi:hypothetical protein